MQVVELTGKREDEIGARDSVFGVTAIYRVAGECGRVAEIFETEATIAAGAVGSTHPGDADASAGRKFGGGSGNNFADDLMAGDEWRTMQRQFAFYDVEISATDSAGANAQEDLTRLWLRRWDIGDLKRTVSNVLRGS